MLFADRHEDRPVPARCSRCLLKSVLESRVNIYYRVLIILYAPANHYYNFGKIWAEILAERCEQEGVDGDIDSTVNLWFLDSRHEENSQTN